MFFFFHMGFQLPCLDNRIVKKHNNQLSIKKISINKSKTVLCLYKLSLFKNEYLCILIKEASFMSLRLTQTFTQQEEIGKIVLSFEWRGREGESPTIKRRPPLHPLELNGR